MGSLSYLAVMFNKREKEEVGVVMEGGEAEVMKGIQEEEEGGWEEKDKM